MTPNKKHMFRKRINLIITRLKDMKLRNKITLNYVCFGLIPLLLIGSFAMHHVQNIMFEQEAVRNQDYLKQAIFAVNGQLNVYNALSDYVSFNNTVSRICKGEYESEYERYVDYTDGFKALIGSMKYFHNEIEHIVLYLNQQGVEYEDCIMPITEIQQQKWYDNLENNSIKWVANKNKVFLVRQIPFIRENGKINVLYIEINRKNLFQWFENMTDTDYGIYLVNENNRIIYNTQKFSKKNRNQILSLKEVKKEKKNQKNYIVTKEEIEDSGWSVYLYRPSTVIREKIEDILHKVIFTVLISSIICLICIRSLTKKTVRGIEQLQKNMKEIEKGNFELHVHSESKDEVGDLIRGFGAMVSKIRILIEEVYTGNIKQKEYEMRALQAQINPHFLYNSLSLINWMALEEGQEEISKITLAMSSFYRTALNKGNNIILLENEIENIKSYLEIQLMMHDYEFDVEIKVDDTIKKCEVLNLILQPMLENAIEHGIDLKTDGRGKIRVEAIDRGDVLLLEVEDNGIGMEEEVQDVILTKQSKGYGLRNVNERIRLYYGEEYHITIESKLGVGTKIITTLPKRIREE